jgi:hypothetical protein
MVTKLVVGLTNVLDEGIVKSPKTPDWYGSDALSVNSYVIPASCKMAPIETLEWMLDTELPAVIGLLSTIKEMKTRLTLIDITSIEKIPLKAPSAEYKSFSLLFGLMNYIPNPAVQYTEFTDEDFNSLVVYSRFGDLILEEVDGYEANGVPHTSLLSYAYDNNTTENLVTAYPNRIAAPMFNVRFDIGEKNSIPQKNMPLEFNTWFNNNTTALNAKGWELDNPKSRIGAYVMGRLIGEPWDQYLKLLNNPYICTIDIIEE